MHIDGYAIKPTFLADPALSVHQPAAARTALLAGALSVDDDTKFALRVVSSSPRRCRLLGNMEEKLGDVLVYEQSGRPLWAIWPLRSELRLCFKHKEFFKHKDNGIRTNDSIAHHPLFIASVLSRLGPQGARCRHPSEYLLRRGGRLRCARLRRSARPRPGALLRLPG